MAELLEITSHEQWKELLEHSQDQPFFLFKHSTTCPVSAFAHRQVQSFQTNYPVYYVKVIENRPLSLEIADDLHVQHQSPQAILVMHRLSKWNQSHYDITEESLASAIDFLL
ncbi:bacillithiol system redox-active protein YtxJ [Chryseomicrobium sp. FSL W7-1435]|uniref:bacillithiol system redox-active protein YtxJ n=1 Tax=Chryseomicrobium sp. FSL W7-1435 TaxID=2921704 RepID=UPI00315ACE1F